MQVVRDLAERLALLAPDAELERPVRVAGQAVLAYLVGAVRQLNLDGDVLARSALGRGEAVGGTDQEGDHVVGLLVPGYHPVRAPHLARGESGLRVQAVLQGDQGVGHQPVDLVPGGGDLGGDGIAQHLDDGREQVGVDHRVLVLGDAERDVLVGDARQHGVGALVGVGQQRAGEGRDRTRESLLLAAVGLVAAVEQVVEQLRVGLEQTPVEHLADLADGRAHDGQGGFDGAGGPG